MDTHACAYGSEVGGKGGGRGSADAVEITSLHLCETRNGNTTVTAHVLVVAGPRCAG